MSVLGIDPGGHGAIAEFDEAGQLVKIHDMPVTPEANGRSAVNAPLLAAIIAKTHARVAFCEFVGARPTDSKALREAQHARAAFTRRGRDMQLSAGEADWARLDALRDLAARMADLADRLGDMALRGQERLALGAALDLRLAAGQAVELARDIVGGAQ